MWPKNGLEQGIKDYLIGNRASNWDTFEKIALKLDIWRQKPSIFVAFLWEF